MTEFFVDQEKDSKNNDNILELPEFLEQLPALSNK